jgi:ATP-binding cassette subfamily C protein LapB
MSDAAEDTKAQKGQSGASQEGTERSDATNKVKQKQYNQSKKRQHKDTSWLNQHEQHHPLVRCLRIIAGHYGRRTSENALTAGLPLSDDTLSPDLLRRMAERVYLNCDPARQTLSSLARNPNKPCIVVLKDGRFCILWKVVVPKRYKKSAPGKRMAHARFIVQFPETARRKNALSYKALKELYAGEVFFTYPYAREDERTGPMSIDVNRNWFWGVLWQNKGVYAEVILAAIFINLFVLASPLFIMNVYDRVIPNSAEATLWVLAGGVLMAFTFDFILKQLRTRFLDEAGQNADIKISSNLYEQLVGMKMSSQPASAGVMASYMREFEQIRDFFTSATLVTLIDFPFALLFIGIIYLLAGPVAFVPLAAFPIVIIGGLIMQWRLKKVTQETMQESALKNAYLFESMSGLETLKMQAVEGSRQQRWEEIAEKSAETAKKSRNLSAMTQHFAGYVQQISSVFIVIAGFYVVQNTDMTMGALIAAVILNGRAMAPLGQIAGLLTRMNQARSALGELDEMMQKPVERPAGKHFIPKPEIEGHLQFREVTFHYPDQNMPSLKNVSFSIAAGEKVGVVGGIGSGKTTLSRLIANLYQPDSGAIQIDGVDTRQIDPGDLRRNIGFVQQNPQFFYGTVRENITLGKENVSDELVIKAAELSGTMEFVRRSEAGLDTHVGENGQALSGGQRQSIAIARALLYNPPILIMDEPTASLDPGSEKKLIQRLNDIGKHRTLLLISHKPALLSIVNKLILLDGGTLLDIGPRDEVVEKLNNGQYNKRK